MGHHINAVIGAPRDLSALVDLLGEPRPTELPFGLVIVPLDEDRLDTISMSIEEALDGFTYLKPAMVAQLGCLMKDGRALYIETDYFGGMGGQAAALLESGSLSWTRSDSTTEPNQPPSLWTRIFRSSATSLKSPISEGLRILGVVSGSEHDEFDAVGLARFRSLEALGICYDD